MVLCYHHLKEHRYNQFLLKSLYNQFLLKVMLQKVFITMGFLLHLRISLLAHSHLSLSTSVGCLTLRIE